MRGEIPPPFNCVVVKTEPRNPISRSREIQDLRLRVSPSRPEIRDFQRVTGRIRERVQSWHTKHAKYIWIGSVVLQLRDRQTHVSWGERDKRWLTFFPSPDIWSAVHPLETEKGWKIWLSGASKRPFTSTQLQMLAFSGTWWTFWFPQNCNSLCSV